MSKRQMAVWELQRLHSQTWRLTEWVLKALQTPEIHDLFLALRPECFDLADFYCKLGEFSREYTGEATK